MFSQQEITGIVKDSSQNPIAYANVALLRPADSTVVQGTITSGNGRFFFENPKEKHFLLKVSFVGYVTTFEEIELAENVKFHEITLQKNTSNLDEVTINTIRPKIYRETDRLIFSVENTALSSGSTWEILKKTPGVITIQGNLTIKNTAATVYINNKKVRLPAEDLQVLLENYSGENIRQIEVIANPSAAYDADSGPILNIVTSKTLVPGYKGSIFGNYTQAIYPKYSIGTSHFYKTEKLDLFVNYSFNPRKEFKNDESFINFIDENGTVFSKWRSDFERTTRSSAHNANAILDYDFNENNSLNFQATTLFSPGKTFDNRATTRIFNAQNQLDSLYRTDSNLENDLHNISLDLGFAHQFEKEETQLSANVHFTDYEHARFQQVATDYFDADGNSLNENDFFTDASQKTRIYSGKLDFETTFGSVAFQSGVKISNIDSESGLDFFEVGIGGAAFNENLSDLFLYDETVFAGYVSFAKDWEKWGAKIGLRGEQTEREGTSVSTETSNSRNHFELFPSAYISYKLSEKHHFSFDYGRKISRPKYEALNPFKYFIDENNFKAGNPNLTASISNNFNLNYTYKNAYSFDFYYRDNGRNANLLVFQDNQNLSIRSVYANVEESKSYGIDFFHGRSIKNWWYSQAVLSLFHEEETFVTQESNDQLHTNEIDGFYASLYNGLTLSKDGTFSGNVTFLYISDFLQGSYQMENILSLSFGLRKTLWNNRAEISLQLEDVLNESAVPLTSNYLNQNNGFFSHPENRFVRIGFQYNFGNFRLGDNERQSNTEEEERL
ncbi:MAG TPA: outer membrane beta-barrel family protein [Flavobacteriaceae bacterium]|nr:outer membrane beta-barrel family protein [Flavobacteriaceae bacterium]